MTLKVALLGGASVLLVSACGSSPRLAPVDELGTDGGAPVVSLPTSPATDGPPEVIIRRLPDGDAPAPATMPQTPAPARTPANPAVVALLNAANDASRSGRHDKAAASIERALAIEPRSPWLWHRLAATRLQQGDLGQAAALAAKSNSLAGEDKTLQADNWRLIAEVHRRRGEHTAARSAAEKADRLGMP